MLLLSLMMGCLSECSKSTPQPPVPVEHPAPARPAVSAPAPTKSVWGLELGVAAEDAVNAWIAARDLSCAYGPAQRRTTMHWTCKGPVDPAKIPERKIVGAIDELLFARLDAGPLHHVSLERVYSLPAQAMDDFSATIAEITQLLGAAERESIPSADTNWSSPMVHGSASWRFADLEVRVMVLKGGGSTIRVGERWFIPGAEDAAVARPGSAPMHGGAVDQGGNPHERTAE